MAKCYSLCQSHILVEVVVMTRNLKLVLEKKCEVHELFSLNIVNVVVLLKDQLSQIANPLFKTKHLACVLK